VVVFRVGINGRLTPGEGRRGTIQCLRSDVFERAWTHRRGMARYCVLFDDGTSEYWVQRRHMAPHHTAGESSPISATSSS
jgi:hypothetical protein